MAVVLVLAGSLVYVRVAGNLNTALDEQLRSNAQDVSALVRRDGSLESTSGTLVERGESFAELLSSSGGVLDSTAPGGARSLLSASELDGARQGAIFFNRPSVPGLDEPARLLALPVVRGSSKLVLIVGATRENRVETLRSLRNAFLIGGRWR
jgi:hypothetical protein